MFLDILSLLVQAAVGRLEPSTVGWWDNCSTTELNVWVPITNEEKTSLKMLTTTNSLAYAAWVPAQTKKSAACTIKFYDHNLQL